MTVRLVRLGIAALLAVAAFATPVRADRRHVAERFDVTLRPLADGRLEVTETVRLRFEGDASTFFFREVPFRRTDGIALVQATIDGRPLPPGTQAGQVEVARTRERLRVRWHFQPISDGSHEFVMTYMVKGALQATAAGSRLDWRALPSRHNYAIARSRISLVAPAGSDPRVATRRVGTHALARDADGWAIDATDIRRNGYVQVSADLPFHLAVTPAWQRERDRHAAAAPRAAGFAALAGVLALITLVALRAQFPGKPAIDRGPRHERAPPDDLPPALAAALVNGGRPSLAHALAALFEMADEGLVVVEERPRGAFRTRRFAIRRPAEPRHVDLRHAALLEILFPEGATDLDLSSLGTRLMWKGKVFRGAARDELRHRGLLDETRRVTRRRILALGGALLALAAAGVPIALLSGSPFGPWALLVPLALALVGFAALIVGVTLADLSDEGYRRAPRWVAFRRYLRDAARGRTSIDDPARAARYLRYAAAFGLGGVWAAWLKKHANAVQLPDWFKAAAAEDGGSGAFAAMLAATAASTGGSSSAGSGAGGGASGAG